MLKLDLSHPVKAKLLKQSPEIKPNRAGGTDIIYTLEVDGAVIEYKATARVHENIQEKVKAGQWFELNKVPHGDNPSWSVILVNAIQSAPTESAQQSPVSPSAAPGGETSAPGPENSTASNGGGRNEEILLRLAKRLDAIDARQLAIEAQVVKCREWQDGTGRILLDLHRLITERGADTPNAEGPVPF